MDSKAPSKNPSLVFEDVGSAGGRAEFRKSGTSPYALSLVCIDSANKSTFHTLITNGGSRNWVIPSELAEIKNSFQAGVDTLYNKCKNRGATPSSKTPTAISAAIDTIYTNRYNSGFNAGQQAAAVSFTQTRASQISFYNPGYHYFDISASESGYDYLIVSGWFSGRITSVEVSNSATKVLASKILSTGDGTNTMVHCILQKPANSCRVKFNHSGSGNGYVIVYGAK